MENESNHPLAVLFGRLEIQTEEQLETILQTLNNEIATVFLIHAVKHAYERGVYNICSGNQYKLKDVINTLYRLTNSKSEIIFDKNLNRKDNSNFLCGDNTKIKKLSNIYKLIDIEEGLSRTIEFYERQNNIKR